MENRSAILDDVAQYYTGKLAEHGCSARGVDWNGEESQTLRFDQLSRIINGNAPYSINDLGCGYGAMADYFAKRHDAFTYHGYDISKEMIEAADSRHASDNIRFFHGDTPTKADYSVASGIFNVRLAATDEQWLEMILRTLDTMHEASSNGFSFNCLTSYSDADKMRDYLYYADPLMLFDHCKRRYSRHVALLHDYGLYEFTILVRHA